jgi:hypothetical protein
VKQQLSGADNALQEVNMTDVGKYVRDSEGYQTIFRKTIRTRNGKVLIAAHFGLQAFPIRIRIEPSAQMELF